MYAVIRTGGKQYRVEAGKELLIEKLMVEAGQEVQISDVLLFANDTGVRIGNPLVPMKVLCQCVGHEKGEKLRTVKYRRRKNFRRTYGHRQTYTRLRIQGFSGEGT